MRFIFAKQELALAAFCVTDKEQEMPGLRLDVDDGDFGNGCGAHADLEKLPLIVVQHVQPDSSRFDAGDAADPQPGTDLGKTPV